MEYMILDIADSMILNLAGGAASKKTAGRIVAATAVRRFRGARFQAIRSSHPPGNPRE
jgi:hypothetical protein